MTIGTFESVAVTSRPHSTSWRYIYGIVPSEDTILFDVAGLDEAEVYTIPFGSLAAVVSATNCADYRHLERQAAVGYLLAHQRVIEAVMEHVPVLPLRFGTTLCDETQVQALLAQGTELFQRTLTSLHGAVQFEVLALWDLGRVFQLIGAEPEVAALKAQVATLPLDESAEARIAVGRLVKDALERRRLQLQDALSTPLREVARDSISHQLMDDSMVLNLALLVDADRRGALEDQLDALDELFGTGDDHLPPLQLRLVGPLAPYSFAGIEVEVPSYATVSAARNLLGLDEAVEPDSIRRRYRQQAARLHPDFNPNLPDAEAQMSALSHAYRLLSAYAEARMQATGQMLQQVSFDQEAVEQTLVITLRRQDD